MVNKNLALETNRAETLDRAKKKQDWRWKRNKNNKVEV
jgi:hypothetical protein